MKTKTLRTFLVLGAKELRDISAALATLPLLGLSYILPLSVMSTLCANVASQVGILIPHLRIMGLSNLTIAFPEKSNAERLMILRQSWGNLGRVVTEYFYMDRLWDYDPSALQRQRIEISGIENYKQLAQSVRGSIIVSAHLANWELPMLAAYHHELAATALYKKPHNRWITRIVLSFRRKSMGQLIEAGPAALSRLSQSLANGIHVGMLVDQYHIRGVKVHFFGRQTKAGAIFAHLARLYDCPVHMVRVIRLPENRFRVELGEALNLPRAEDGQIDIHGSVQLVTNIIEGWIREYPEQWLWMHRRWR
jgi:KDO2-lipid IV(A) lauroyltransferase